MNPTTTEIVKFDFHGDELDVVHAENGISLSVRRMCEILGLDFKSQHAKLTEKPWACMVLITTHDTTGRRQEMTCLPLKSVSMWLATIDAEKVKPEIHPKLERLQCECADVLHEHFFPSQVTPPAPVLLTGFVDDACNGNAQLLHELGKTRDRIIEITLVLSRIYGPASAVAIGALKTQYYLAKLKDSLKVLSYRDLKASIRKEYGQKALPAKAR